MPDIIGHIHCYRGELYLRCDCGETPYTVEMALREELRDTEGALAVWRHRTERAEKIVDRVLTIAPYVIATLPHASPHVVHSSVTTSDPDWVAVHRGRAVSSRRQLETLEEEAREVLRENGAKESQ